MSDTKAKQYGYCQFCNGIAVTPQCANCVMAERKAQRLNREKNPDIYG